MLQEQSTLTHNLGKHFNFNLARLKCMSLMILAIIETRTINLTRIAQFFGGETLLDSSYKKLQRFIKNIIFNEYDLAKFILKIIGIDFKKN